MKRLFFILFSMSVVMNISSRANAENQNPPYKNQDLSIQERVDDLLRRMSLEEKVYQMCALRLGEGDEIFKTSGEYSADFVRGEMSPHGVGHISCPTTDMDAQRSVTTINEIQRIAVEETRLGIPVLVNDEALHGVIGRGATSYPQSIALSCTWDLNLMSEISDAIGKETFSRGVRQVLSPTLDLARDPRHGRMEETYGEDPYLASRFGVKYVQGVQRHGVICSPKHFVANFVADGGRDAGNIALSERELREIHLVPYKAAVMEAGVKSIMAAYNAIDGVPCSSNKWLLTDVLRNEWGFTGFVVSDWSGVNHTFGHHKVARSLGEAAVFCSKAGLDVDLPRIRSFRNLIEMVKEGKIKEEFIDKNVERILRVKFELGLFEAPYIDETLTTTLKKTPAFRDLAYKAACKSIVLLKNEKSILPLRARNIAVIGPNADKLQLGGYSARGVAGVTPLQGLRKAFGDSNITYAKGCELTGEDKSGFAEAMSVAQKADVCILVMGGSNGLTGGETRDRATLDLMGVQEDLINEISSLGKPVIVVLVDGRPVTMSGWIDKVDGLVMMFFAGEEGGNALADIVAGKVNPSGKLTVTFPRNVGDVPMNQLHRPYGREGKIAEYPRIPESRYVPLFPFGYGLSYTSYEYGDIKIAKKEYKVGENVSFSIDVTNTGNMDGEEIVQVYLTDLYSRISLAPKQLKSFKRVYIPAGETRRVDFVLSGSDLSFLNEKLQPEVEPGEFEITVGMNSLEGKTEKFEIK